MPLLNGCRPAVRGSSDILSFQPVAGVLVVSPPDTVFGVFAPIPSSRNWIQFREVVFMGIATPFGFTSTAGEVLAGVDLSGATSGCHRWRGRHRRGDSAGVGSSRGRGHIRCAPKSRPCPRPRTRASTVRPARRDPVARARPAGARRPRSHPWWPNTPLQPCLAPSGARSPGRPYRPQRSTTGRPS